MCRQPGAVEVAALALASPLLLVSCGSQPAYTERTIEGHAEVEVEEIPVDSPGHRTSRRGDVDEYDPSTFPRDQPPIRALKRWNGSYVVAADALYGLDVAAGEAHPLVLAGADEVLDVAMRGQVAVALVRRGDQRVLFQAEDDRWVERNLPDAIRTGSAPLTLAADEAAIVLFAADRVYRLRGSTWTNAAVGAPPLEVRGGPAHALLVGDKLYLGWDAGEWGGRLFVLDVGSGAWGPGPDENVPVHDIVLGPDGRVWVATGLAHLGIRRGALHRHDGDGWTTVVATGDPVPAQNHDWNLPPDAFQAVAFGPDGTLNLLTGTLGVVSRDDNGLFHQRTLDWPASRYLYVQALQLERDLAVIASADAGVWLWDLHDETIRRVVLRAHPR